MKISPTLDLIWRTKSYSFLILMFFVISCNGQNQSNTSETNSLSSDQLIKKETQVVVPEYGFNSGFLDDDGVLWFGSNGGGIYRYDGKSFAHFSESEGLCSNQVFSIIEDKEGNLWFGTAKGLCKYDRKTFTHVPIPFSDTSGIWLDQVYPIINPNAVHSLIQDRKGDFWIGTGGGGAYRYDGKNFSSVLSDIGRKQEDSLYHNWVPGIMEDEEGNIWFASMTHGGASRFDGKSFTHFMPKDGLTDDMVRTIFKDKSGNLWFGFNGNRNSGLTYYDGKSFVSFHKKDGLCNTRVRAIFEDKQGNIWLGANLGNLCIYDGETFKEFKTQDGKTISNVLFILEDGKDNIWLGGRDGLQRFDGEIVTDMTHN